MKRAALLTGLLMPLVLMVCSCDGGDDADSSGGGQGKTEPSETHLQLIVMGPPGAGKGTQSHRISEAYQLPHISTGAILRTEVKKGTELGKEVGAIMDKGELVADDIVIQLVENRLNDQDCERGFILDGFPRSIAQAEALSAVLERRDQRELVVVSLSVPDEVLVARLRQRQRADDTEATIKNRIRIYHEQTAPLMAYYESKGVLKIVNGNQTIEAVSREIISVLSGD